MTEDAGGNRRKVLAVAGGDRFDFLQGLVTNDVRPGMGLTWAALLTPQGKYLFDFFLLEDGDRILVDVARDQAAALAQRLGMYRLRADVQISDSGLGVARGTGAPPEGAHMDPRDPGMGWRLYGTDLPPEEPVDWDALRVAHMVPEAGRELIHGESYILEMGFERLNGVSFRKGCYVGQEVTARMKHKTELKKGLARLRLAGPVPEGSPVMRAGREIGRVHTVAGDRALAWLRFDRAGPGMESAGQAVEVEAR